MCALYTKVNFSTSFEDRYLLYEVRRALDTRLQTSMTSSEQPLISKLTWPNLGLSKQVEKYSLNQGILRSKIHIEFFNKTRYLINNY